MELSDEDLVKLGVDDSDLRAKLIEEVKNLPIYEETDHMYVICSYNKMGIVGFTYNNFYH